MWSHVRCPREERFYRSHSRAWMPRDARCAARSAGNRCAFGARERARIGAASACESGLRASGARRFICPECSGESIGARAHQARRIARDALESRASGGRSCRARSSATGARPSARGIRPQGRRRLAAREGAGLGCIGAELAADRAGSGRTCPRDRRAASGASRSRKRAGSAGTGRGRASVARNSCGPAMSSRRPWR